MRLYSFTNMYTSGIHAGIQTAHVIHEMMRKYEKKQGQSHKERFGLDPKLAALYDWADNHKTIIVKSAGYHEHLVALYDELKPYSAYFQMPMGRWRESKAALNNAQTAVCIVLPSSVYAFKEPEGYQQQFPRKPFDEPTEMAYNLNMILHRYRMAT